MDSDGQNSLAELAKLLPTTTSRQRKPLRCVVSEAIRDGLISDIPTALVDNDKVASMLEADYTRASAQLDSILAEEAGAEEMLERRKFLQDNAPVTSEDQELLAEVCY